MQLKLKGSGTGSFRYGPNPLVRVKIVSRRELTTGKGLKHLPRKFSFGRWSPVGVTIVSRREGQTDNLKLESL